MKTKPMVKAAIILLLLFIEGDLNGQGKRWSGNSICALRARPAYAVKTVMITAVKAFLVTLSASAPVKLLITAGYRSKIEFGEGCVAR